jgi:hypothetical protein
MSETDLNTSANESKPVVSRRSTKFIDMTGTKWGKLTVISRDIRPGGKRVLWHCVCECGNKTVVDGVHLRDGHTKSCGCIRRDQVRQMGYAKKTHGHSINGKMSKEYNVWHSMKQRCDCQNHKSFKDYGGRGITVCSRWKNSFEAFFADMGTRPAGHSLERKDNYDNYGPKNCVWATQKQQSRNRRSNKLLAYRDETLCLAEWSDRLGGGCNLVGLRLRAGWSVERALTEPVHRECDSSANRSG